MTEEDVRQIERMTNRIKDSVGLEEGLRSFLERTSCHKDVCVTASFSVLNNGFTICANSPESEKILPHLIESAKCMLERLGRERKETVSALASFLEGK